LCCVVLLLRCVVLILDCVVLDCVVSCCVVLWCVVLCRDVLCCDVLCCLVFLSVGRWKNHEIFIFFLILISVKAALVFDLLNLLINYFFFKEQCSRKRQWQPTPVLLSGQSHGQRSLAGCSPWGRWELDTAECLHFHFSLLWIGKGNGNPLQCSCLENPRNRGAWWAAIYGVAESDTTEAT